MTSPLQKILESKRALRHELASRPIAEKLRMLDAMREREMAIRHSVRTGREKTFGQQPEESLERRDKKPIT